MDQNNPDPHDLGRIKNVDEAVARIDAVLKKVRGFAYDEGLLTEAGYLIDWAETQDSSKSKYRAISLAIEIYNEYGSCDKSKSIIHQFEEAMRRTLAGVSADGVHNLSVEQIENTQAVVKQVCWIYAGAAITHYWYHENEEGLKWVRDANDVINNYLTTPHNGKVPDCTGLRARVSYYEALNYVQLNDAEKAEKALRDSLSLAQARLARLADEHQNEPDYWESPDGAREARYTNICIAKIQGFVKARIHLLRGQLKESEFMLKSAQVVLRQAHSPTMSQMISYWLYKVQRAIAGRDEKELNPIIDKLKDCYEEFSGKQPTQQNRFYATAAAFEFALSNLYKAQGLRHDDRMDTPEYRKALETATEFADKVGVGLHSPKDQWPLSDDLARYWEFKKLLVTSRIQREMKAYAAAKNAAKEALMIAEKLTKKIGEKIIKRSELIIEADITIGEALLKDDKPAKAINHFNTAETENEQAKNVRVRAVCCLRKAEAYIALNQKHEAIRMLDEWNVLEAQVESGVISYIAKKVKKQLEGLIGDFHISEDTGETKLNPHTKRLEEWLTFLLLSRHQKTGDKRPDPRRLSEDMGISLSKAYKLIRAVEGPRKKPDPEQSESSAEETVA